MVNPIGSGGTHPVAALYGKKGEPESVRTSGQHYDQVQFSSHLSETEKRIKETSGQLVQRIRTRPSRQELDALRQQIADSGRTIHEVLTVASLIEKETDGADRADIASVIYNRLNNPNSSAGTNGYLQIDATLAYLNGSKVPTEADKSIDSPYNTYLYPGLPPGPIANPGLESIKAAMEPESTSYYYYTLGDDNKHHFFNTYGEMTSFMSTQALYSGG